MSEANAAPATRLLLILPAADAPAAESSHLAAAGDVAAVILRASPSASAAALRGLVEAWQGQGAAVLIEGAPALVAATGADGVHTDAAGAAALLSARASRPAIVGVGALATRHDAMTFGESGADYVMFGAWDGSDAARARELAAWWVELFEVPCVAVADSLDAVWDLAAARVDFIALPPALVSGPDAAAVVAAAQAHIDKAGASQ